MDRLMEMREETLAIVQEFLTKRGEFGPVCMVAMADGNVQPFIVSGDAPDTTRLIGWYVEELRSRAATGDLAASVLAVDVRVKHPETGAANDAIMMMVRSQDSAVDITVPYTIETSGGFFRRKRTVTLGNPVEKPAPSNEVFD